MPVAQRYSEGAGWPVSCGCPGRPRLSPPPTRAPLGPPVRMVGAPRSREARRHAQHDEASARLRGAEPSAGREPLLAPAVLGRAPLGSRALRPPLGSFLRASGRRARSARLGFGACCASCALAPARLQNSLCTGEPSRAEWRGSSLAEAGAVEPSRRCRVEPSAM